MTQITGVLALPGTRRTQMSSVEDSVTGSLFSSRREKP